MKSTPCVCSFCAECLTNRDITTSRHNGSNDTDFLHTIDKRVCLILTPWESYSHPHLHTQNGVVCSNKCRLISAFDLKHGPFGLFCCLTPGGPYPGPHLSHCIIFSLSRRVRVLYVICNSFVVWDREIEEKTVFLSLKSQFHFRHDWKWPQSLSLLYLLHVYLPAIPLFFLNMFLHILCLRPLPPSGCAPYAFLLIF